MKKQPINPAQPQDIPKEQTAIKKNLVIQKKIVEICSMIAVVLIALVFVVLSVASIMQTSRIDSANPSSEFILYDNDSIPVNLALILITLIAAIALMRRNIRLSVVNTRFIIFIMLIVTTLIPLIWINLTQSVASGEARTILDTAKGAAQDNYETLAQPYAYGRSYFLFYPDKLGYVFFAEILYRIFGAGSSDILLQIPNVAALGFVYVGLVMLTNRIFQRKALTNLTAIALALCLQPMFMTTYTDSVLIGLAFAVWSVFFTVRYMQDNRLWLAGIAALLITLAVVLKHEYLIFLIAVCIALVLHTVDTMRFLSLAAVAVMIVCSIFAPKLIASMYSSRSDVKLNAGVTFTLKRYQGISDSSMAPGWFNWNAVTTLVQNGMNTSEADKAANEAIDSRIKELNESGLLGDFFKQKFLSQFNEPAFESVWVSQVRGHNYGEGVTEPKLVSSVYTGGLAKLLDRWFNYYDMIVYAGFAAGMIWMLYRRRMNPDAIILPTAVLGGVIYLMLTEAKSQYFLPYFILLIPFAMYGILESAGALRSKAEFLFKAQKAE